MADRGQITGACLDGPLGFDNAVSLEAAETKGIESLVAGRADILLVPDLEYGNILAKQLAYLAGAEAAGIVLGAWHLRPRGAKRGSYQLIRPSRMAH
jgi:phosphate acetyltransferase